MKMETVGSPKKDLALDGLIESCNAIQSTIYQSRSAPVSRDESGPLRWRESCNKKIAVARDVLQFRIILEMTQVDDERDVIAMSLSRKFHPNMMFDQLLSTYIDGKAVQPTNHSLHRTLDLHFNAVHSGSTIVITYRTRVNFIADTSIVAVGDTNVQWSYLSRSKHPNRNRAHEPAARVPAPLGIGLAKPPSHASHAGVPTLA